MKSLNPIYKKKAFKLSGSSSRLYLIMRSKFILSFLLLILIPLFVFGAVMQVKGSFSLIDQNSKQIIYEFDNYISCIESFFNVSSKNESLLSLMEELPDNPNQLDTRSYTKAQEILLDTASGIQNLNITGIYFLRNQQPYTVYCKYYTPTLIDNMFKKNWYADAVKNPQKVKFIGTSLKFFGQGDKEYVFSAAKAIKDQSGKEIGVLLVDFNYHTLDDIIKKSNYFSDMGDLYIINQEPSNKADSPPGNTIMYCKSDSLLTAPLDEGIQQALNNTSHGTYLRNIDDKEYNIVSFNSSSKIKWKAIYLLPVHEAIFNISSFGDNSLLIISACLLLFLAFPFVVHIILLKPIARLASVITEYEKGSFPTRMNLDAQNTDAALQPESPDSTSNVDNLINKVYYNQLKQKEAELNSLQNKINPHFLYNTLESIRGAALYHGIDSIASMAKSLSLLFRYSINSNVLVTVREEIENLDNYITIQNFRHDDKFEVIYNIPEKVYDYKMLKLILQPIVENSIKHGLEMKLGKGVIKVTIWDVGSIFKIEISDDGIGIPHDKILELNKRLSDGSSAPNENGSGSGTGIGILNVNSRIKLYFGEQYGIKFREAQVGTIVEIVIPVVE